jgi:hypothetical protein
LDIVNKLHCKERPNFVIVIHLEDRESIFVDGNLRQRIVRSHKGSQTHIAPLPPSNSCRATHGFFDPPPVDRQRRREAGQLLFAGAVQHLTFDRNPLLLSGLVLSGANRSDDGVLTAEEVMDLDLHGCELAVLLACQTAERKQSGWQGVMGLEQAFHAAGARTLVVSLWSVAAAICVLMEEFYKNLWGKKDAQAQGPATSPDRCAA